MFDPHRSIALGCSSQIVPVPCEVGTAEVGQEMVGLGLLVPVTKGFATQREAMDEVIDWLTFHNHRRLHSTLDYISPVKFK